MAYSDSGFDGYDPNWGDEFSDNDSPNVWELETGPIADDQSEQIIYGEYPSDNVYGNESLPGQRDNSTQSTVNANQARNRERLTRARLDSGRLPRLPAYGNAGVNEKRRVDEQNTKALNEAIRRWRGGRENAKSTATAQSDTSINLAETERAPDTDNNRKTSTLQPNPGVVAPLPLPKPEFEGCEFEAVLHRLYLTANGEWIVQLKVIFEDKAQARKLDVTSGMALNVKITQV